MALLASVPPEHMPGWIGQCIGDAEPEPSLHAEARELGEPRTNGMFTPAIAPPGRDPIGGLSGCISGKTNEFGEVMKAKTRFVAKGLVRSQGQIWIKSSPQHGHPHLSAVLVATAAKQDTYLFQIDREQAFIQVDLDTELFTRLPSGCDQMPAKVALLQTSLYDLENMKQTFDLAPEGARFRAVLT